MGQVGASRTWTDSTGRQVTAVLEGFEDENTVLLRLENGTIVPFPIEKLSPADASFAKESYTEKPNSPGIDWENPKESENYDIRGLRRENSPGYVSTKAGWEYRIKCVEAKVEFRGSQPSAPGEIKAYFFDRDGRMIEKFDGPPRQQDENRKYVTLPKEFEQGEAIEVYFPLTEFLEKGDWATVVVVFGSGEDYAVSSMPGTSLENLDFPEKEYLFPGWEGTKLSGSGSKDSGAMVDVEIRRFRKDTHRYSIVFDGDYQSDKPCMTAEVRASGDILPAEGIVEMFVFTEEGRVVSHRKKPSPAQIDGTSSYVANPKIADDSWHPVFFALDEELTDKDYPTYVLYFEYQGKATAVIESSNGATIEELSFPGKKKLSQ